MSNLIYRCIITALLCMALSCGAARAADYYVNSAHPQANNSNPGTGSAPWLTIQKAASVMKAGDTCFVMPGTYDERVRPASSGEPGRFVTFKAEGKVVVRGFQLSSVSHIRIIGFEITQTQAYSFPAVLLTAAHSCQILDNDIHHTTGLGIFFHKSAPSHNVLVRGNRMTFIGSVPGREIGEIAILVAGNGNIVEYNDISRVADFTNVWGKRNILRNNHFHSNTLADFPDFLKINPEGHHIDGLQYYSDGVGTLSRNLVENNLFVDNDVPHAHVLILRNVYAHASSELIFRGNVAVRNGSIAIMAEAFPNLRIYQNTFVDMLSQQAPKARYCVQLTRGATGAKLLNNIFVNSARAGGMTFYADPSSQAGFLADHNLVYQSGDPVQRRGVYKDPRFVNPVINDFRLMDRSPAAGAGGPLTATAKSGTGRNVPVVDAGYFSDGWGISGGDRIRIGTGPSLAILRVDYEHQIIEVDREISWKAGEGVSLAHRGGAPDLGAFEERPEGYDFDVRILFPSPVPGSPITIGAEVTNEECVRFVVFLINGVPEAQVLKPPFRFTWDPSGKVPGLYKLEARAYARYPDRAMTRSDEKEFRVEAAGRGPGR